jgi:hypothetical protein
MNVKIQGGGNGTYANTGSCVAVTNYLQHEDLERMKKGEEVQPFFNQFRDYVSAREVTFKIDNNKAKLSRTDAKFYVITVSPSEKELRCMGGTPQERAEALRRYIRQDVMRNYAEGFGKGLRSDDVEYYAKIHFNRDGDSDSDMHAHIIVSRKDRSNTRKLSPKTNHTGKKNCGNVKGSFDRTDFFRKCESSFDRRMGFDREPEESFDYLNAVKNGNPTSSSPLPRSSRRKIWNSGRSPKRAEVLAWAVGNFSIFRHKGSYARRICQGTFHSPGKKSPVLASLVRYFLPFALDKYSVLRWQVFRKKEKNVALWWGVRFVILLPLY